MPMMDKAAPAAAPPISALIPVSALVSTEQPTDPAQSRLVLKPPTEAFTLPAPAVQSVQFLHPGYPDNQNILLVLPALDAGGIHQETARVACAILANCSWDGYLTATRNGARLPLGPDDVLTGLSYYFRVDGDPNYAVVPSFDHLRLSTTLPDSWTAAHAPINRALSDTVPDRDGTCRITCSALPNEIAHIVPAAQGEWWRSNTMFMYTTQPERSMDTNCPENALVLRRDVHYLWDSHKFAILPKQGRWVVHVLNNLTTDELQRRYHNLEIQALSGVRREFLLARFALAILTEKNMFARQGYPRNLVMVEDGKVQKKILSGDECRALFGYGVGKSRSRSPKKRQRALQGEGDDDEAEARADISQDRRQARWKAEQWNPLTDGQEADKELDTYDDEQTRGRPRKRRRVDPRSESRSPTLSSPGLTPSLADTSFGSNESLEPLADGFSDKENNLAENLVYPATESLRLPVEGAKQLSNAESNPT